MTSIDVLEVIAQAEQVGDSRANPRSDAVTELVD